MSSTVKEMYQPVIDILTSRKLFLLFFTTACILTIISFPDVFSANEENYFQLAHKRVSPEAFSENSAVFDNSQGRIVSEYIIGSLVKYAGYDFAFIIGRVIVILGYSAALALLLNTINIRLIDTVFCLTIFMKFRQTLFADEWIFGGFEAKILAYIAVLIAIYLFLKNKNIYALSILVLSTYFHFLVGFFWTINIFTAYLLITKNYKKLTSFALLYSILVLPLLLILYPEATSESHTYQGLSVEYIYAHIRNPHHIDPFNSISNFTKHWLDGIIILCFAATFLAVYFKKSTNKKLALLSIVSAGYLIFFVLISYFDRNSLFLSKFYLFRPTSLTFLLIILSAVSTFNKKLNYQFLNIYVTLAVILFFIIFAPILKHKYGTITGTIELSRVNPELVNIINSNTAPEDTVLIDPAKKQKDYAVRAIREISRPTLVAWKFVPTSKQDILRWYDLFKRKEAYFNEGCDGDTLDAHYFIVFDESRFTPFEKCSRILYKNDKILFAKKE